jgi:hypothetical protein
MFPQQSSQITQAPPNKLAARIQCQAASVRYFLKGISEQE